MSKHNLKNKKPAGRSRAGVLPETCVAGPIRTQLRFSDATGKSQNTQVNPPRGRPFGAVPFFKKKVRFSWAAFRALEKYTKLTRADAARWAVALTDLRAHIAVEQFTDTVAAYSCVLHGLPDRSRHILESYRAQAFQADEQLWLEASADHLFGLFLSVRRSAWTNAAIAVAALAELGWTEILRGFFARYGGAPAAAVPPKNKKEFFDALHAVFISRGSAAAKPVALSDPATDVDKDAMPMAGLDLLYGLRAIAGHLGLRPAQCRHLYETHDLPVFKIGKQVCARKSLLDRWLEERQATGRGSVGR